MLLAISSYVAICAAAAAAAAAAAEANPLLPFTLSDPVSVEAGDLTGRCVQNGVCEYLGLPFALPPLADKRWRAPQPMPAWEGVRQFTSFADVCPQVIGPAYIGNEDCLYLNVHQGPSCSKKKGIN